MTPHLNPNDPPALSVTPYYAMPEYVIPELNGLSYAYKDESAHTFLDMNLDRVAMPVHDGEKTPRLTKNHYLALWNLRKGYIRLSEDGTLYARNIRLDGKADNNWHPIASVEEEYDLPTKGASHIGNLEPMFVNEARKFSRMKRGIRFGVHAYHSHDRQVTLEGTTRDEPWLIGFDDKWLDDDRTTMKVIREAEQWLKWLTADKESFKNLVRMFATPFLEPYKHLTYVLWGQGGDGKSYLFNRLHDAFPAMANGVSVGSLTHGSTFDRGNEALKIDGRYWVYDEEGDISEEDMGTIKRISTGDTIQARAIGRNAVNVRSRATLMIATNHRLELNETEANKRRLVTIRMSGRKTPKQMEGLDSFIAEYGMEAFLLVSARLWAAQTDDSTIISPEISDATELSDKLAWMVCEIIDHGYARTTDYRGPNERLRNGAAASIGLKRSCISIEGRKTAVYNVGNEAKFRPFRRLFEQEAEDNRPEHEHLDDFKPVEHHGPVTIEGTTMVPAGQKPDQPKVALNWKRNVESGDYGDTWTPDGKPYAVVPGEGMMVVDCDAAKDGGEHGWEQLASQVDLRETLTVRTPHDGLHLYYRLPDDWKGVLRNSVHRKGLNIDLRLEGKGYVVGPESETSDGRYDIVRDVPVATANTELLEWLASNGYADTTKPVPERRTSTPRDGTPDLSAVPEGSRNSTLFNWALGRAANHPDNLKGIERDLHEKGRNSGLSDTETSTIWNSVLGYL